MVFDKIVVTLLKEGLGIPRNLPCFCAYCRQQQASCATWEPMCSSHMMTMITSLKMSIR